MNRTLDSFINEHLSKKVIGHRVFCLDFASKNNGQGWMPEHWRSLEKWEEQKRIWYYRYTDWRIEDVFEDEHVGRWMDG